MNRMIPFLGAIIGLFLLNIILYGTNQNYKFFVQKLKNPDEIVYPEQQAITDIPTTIAPPTRQELEILSSATVIGSSSSSIETAIPQEEGPVEIQNTTILGGEYQKILDLLSQYNLGKLELHSNLFDVTDEYPDEYYEYYSRDLILYFFPTKTYDEIYDIFSVQPDLPIELNKVDNFGDQSLYINLLPTDTGNVRMIIQHKSIVFGLKIKKDEYNNIKALLGNL